MYFKGIDIDELLAKAHINFIAFGKTKIDFFDYYVVLETNPTFTFNIFSATIKNTMDKYIKMFLGPENKIIISIELINKLVDKIFPINQYIDPNTKLFSYDNNKLDILKESILSMDDITYVN